MKKIIHLICLLFFVSAAMAATDGYYNRLVGTGEVGSGQDKLQLDGGDKNYLLGASGVTNVSGSGLFYDSNANTKLDSTDELIAIIRSANSTTLNAANTVNTGLFV